MGVNTPIAMMIYGEPGSSKSVFTEPKYKELAIYLNENGFSVDSVLYHDSIATKLERELVKYKAILVWVNPVEQGRDRKILDAMLANLSSQSCFVSAHPDTILKMGTKQVLYDVRETEFGTEVKQYRSHKEFIEQFVSENPGIRILKQYRGNGGEGVFKVDTTRLAQDIFIVTHAKTGDKEEQMTMDEFFNKFEYYFDNGSMLIDQPWNPNIINGMVRCYMSGSKVAGFGYQEVNALYPVIDGVYKKPGQRYYYSEKCGLFRDMKDIMENKWVNQLQIATGVSKERLPVLWDADFFINKINSETPFEKYSLCEINVSSVSPFPESSIPYITEEVKKRIFK